MTSKDRPTTRGGPPRVISRVYQRRRELAGTRCEVNSLVALSEEVQMVASGATKLHLKPEIRDGLATGCWYVLSHSSSYYLRAVGH